MKLFTLITRFFSKWNELILTLTLLAAWPLVSAALRFIDPTAAPLDAGVLHVMYIALMWFAIVHAFVWVGLKINVPLFHKYLENNLVHDFKLLSRWQRVLSSLFVFALYLFATLLALIAVAMVAG